MVFFKIYVFFHLSLSLSLRLWIPYDVTVEVRGGRVLKLPYSIPFILVWPTGLSPARAEWRAGASILHICIHE